MNYSKNDFKVNDYGSPKKLVHAPLSEITGAKLLNEGQNCQIVYKKISFLTKKAKS